MNEVDPAFISEGNDETEILVVEVKINGMQVRCINGYAPQENDVIDKKQKFWKRLGDEIEDADKNDKAIIVQMDGNLHAGPEMIPGDPNVCNMNGKLFKEFLNKFPHLTVINGTKLCDKVITRRRVAKGKVEEAALDFFLTCRKILPLVEKMVIDDTNKLTRFTKNKTVESDHNNLFLHLDAKLPHNTKRLKIVTLKDKTCLERFKEETSKQSKFSEWFLKQDESANG